MERSRGELRVSSQLSSSPRFARIRTTHRPASRGLLSTESELVPERAYPGQAGLQGMLDTSKQSCLRACILRSNEKPLLASEGLGGDCFDCAHVLDSKDAFQALPNVLPDSCARMSALMMTMLMGMPSLDSGRPSMLRTSEPAAATRVTTGHQG